jgi:hypothetical protein
VLGVELFLQVLDGTPDPRQGNPVLPSQCFEDVCFDEIDE